METQKSTSSPYNVFLDEEGGGITLATSMTGEKLFDGLTEMGLKIFDKSLGELGEESCISGIEGKKRFELLDEEGYITFKDIVREYEIIAVISVNIGDETGVSEMLKLLAKVRSSETGEATQETTDVLAKIGAEEAGLGGEFVEMLNRFGLADTTEGEDILSILYSLIVDDEGELGERGIILRNFENVIIREIIRRLIRVMWW